MLPYGEARRGVFQSSAPSQYEWMGTDGCTAAAPDSRATAAISPAACAARIGAQRRWVVSVWQARELGRSDRYQHLGKRSSFCILVPSSNIHTCVRRNWTYLTLYRSSSVPEASVATRDTRWIDARSPQRRQRRSMNADACRCWQVCQIRSRRCT